MSLSFLPSPSSGLFIMSKSYHQLAEISALNSRLSKRPLKNAVNSFGNIVSPCLMPFGAEICRFACGGLSCSLLPYMSSRTVM